MGHACIFARRAIVATFLLATFTSSVSNAANSIGATVMLGNERIAIPVAASLDDYTEEPSAKRLALSMIEPFTSLLSFQSQEGPLSKYLVVRTVTADAGKTKTLAAFQDLKAAMLAKVKNEPLFRADANRDAAGRNQKFNEALGEGHSIKDIQVESAKLIGVERNDDHAMTYIMLMPFNAVINGKRQTLTAIMCSSTVLVKGKYILSQLYAPADSEKWVRSTCNRFVSDLIAKNR